MWFDYVNSNFDYYEKTLNFFSCVLVILDEKLYYWSHHISVINGCGMQHILVNVKLSLC
jgi:hypothetical protein